MPKLRANYYAGRKEAALQVAMQIAEMFDSAYVWQKQGQMAEMATVYDTQGKEMQIARQQAKLSQQRLWGMVLVLVLVTIFFVIYTLYRRHTQKRMAEMQVAQERIESELRIARDIQMSMVPSVFPNVEGLDMYASMTPAKEVGGDLYNFLWKGDMLYFCIGDVSGKGVPASLFMTLATRGFLSLASTGKTPAEIATRMNAELSTNNEMGMFVTMFICMYDLKQGRIEYCNAGHNPPVIGNAEGQYAFLDVKEANAPIGLWPDLEYVGEEMDLPSGGIMLLYTDGLNEAENRQQEQYGEDRIIQLMTSHASLSMRDIIEALKADTDQFRDGAEQNDDLTMLAFRITNRQ